MDQSTVLEARNVSKSFPGVRALESFDFTLFRGEIHGLVGENGAGKTTFIKILDGLYQPDSGEIRVLGQRIDRLTPIIANNLGVRFIHQELSVFPYVSITENFFLNSYPTRGRTVIKWAEAHKKAAQMLAEYGLQLDPRTRLDKLSIGQMQLIEIIANVSKNAQIIVMDEPTASLGGPEKEKLFEVMRFLRDRGISVVFITHILEEVLAICDRTTVVRDGARIGTYLTKDLTKEHLIEQIVGVKAKEASQAKGPALASGSLREAVRAEGICFGDRLREVNLSLHYGEILGILGLLGAGKSELANILFGLAKADSGTLTVNTKPSRIFSPIAAIKAGIGYVTEDRHHSGLFHFMSVLKNCSILILRQLRGFFATINPNRERKAVESVIKDLNIRTSGLDQQVRHLSGGNQQKVLLGRWLVANKQILIFDEPTKGVDVGARSEFYKILSGLREEGKAILILTSDHREAHNICDRIHILIDGRLGESILNSDTSPRDLLARLAGQSLQTTGASL